MFYFVMLGWRCYTLKLSSSLRLLSAL